MCARWPLAQAALSNPMVQHLMSNPALMQQLDELHASRAVSSPLGRVMGLPTIDLDSEIFEYTDASGHVIKTRKADAA